MKSVVSTLALGLLFAACASSDQSSGPNVAVQLEQLNVGSDIFYFRGPVNIQYRDLKVAPNATTAYTISVWGYSRGGYLASGEPVTIQGTAYFKGSSGSFVRVFNQNISPLAGS